MIIKLNTNEEEKIKKFFLQFSLPKKNSHKGENGKILVIGGSSLFHAASLWAAEIASFFVDIVHYSSTQENQKIFLNLKKKFTNGIVIPQKNILEYVNEDDVILLGPGMIRGKKPGKKTNFPSFKKILLLKNEAHLTYFLTEYLLSHYPQKKFILDAGALQMMEKDWFLKLKTSPIVTPHQVEFQQLFSIDLSQKKLEEKIKIVKETAKKYKITILLKAITDIISDGEKVYLIEGGNQGLTKGGTGDVLAGLSASFFVKNEPLIAAVAASLLLKKTADNLFKKYGYWYNVSKLIDNIPQTLAKIIF